MSGDRTPGRRRGPRRRSGRIRAILSLGIVLGLGGVNTMAFWTDTATVDSGTFSAGRLDVKLGNPAVDNSPPQFTTDFALSGMVPGSAKDATLRVTNAGTVPFVLSATGSATNSGAGVDQMGSALRISVFSSSSAGQCTGSLIVNGAPINGGFLPTQPALAAAATRDYCLRASLPSDANTALQGTQSTVTITFTASQETP